MKITLMSYNIQWCRDYIKKETNYDLFADEIRKLNADIIGLNEAFGYSETGACADMVKILADKLGYHYYFAKAIDFEGTKPYGNGILSKYPIISAETIMIPDPEVRSYKGWYETRCVLKAKIDVCGGLTVLVTHFGCNPDEQILAQEAVVSLIEDEKCVLMGDFNITPNNPLLVPINEKMFDTAKLFTEELWSFPSDTPRKKIDYLFTSKDIKVVSADIPADVTADHRPHVAVIED